MVCVRHVAFLKLYFLYCPFLQLKKNFCIFLFASLDSKTILQLGLLLKERICSSNSKGRVTVYYCNVPNEKVSFLR